MALSPSNRLGFRMCGPTSSTNPEVDALYRICDRSPNGTPRTQRGSKHPDGELMDAHRKKQCGLSDDTWTRATQELEYFGLLRMTSVFWGDDDYERRRRKRCYVVIEALDESPDWGM